MLVSMAFIMSTFEVGQAQGWRDGCAQIPPAIGLPTLILLLAEQVEDVLGRQIGLSQNRCSGGDHDLVPGELGGFPSDVGISDSTL